MVWRIHFTAEDLTRTRISAGLGPLAETVFALSLLRCPFQRPPQFAGWRERSRGQLSSDLRPLSTLIPAGSRGVDLLTLTGEQATIEEGVEALLAMPRSRLLAEIEDFDRQYALSPAAWTVADQGSDGRRRLADAARAAYDALIEPYWGKISAQLRAEQALRGRILMDGGVERLLTTLQATRVRWRPPVLEVLVSGYADIYLDGRGLILVPSLFIGEIPSLTFDVASDEGIPKLFFPAAASLAQGIQLWSDAPPTANGLAALLGRTRATVLRCIADIGGCTTTELARLAGISPAAASQHATVLRDVGLIATRRYGSAVLHTLAPRGAGLLEGGRDEPAPVRALGD